MATKATPMSEASKAQHRAEYGVPRNTLPARAKGRPVGCIAKGLRERAWRTIREIRQFTLTDLLCTNAEGGEKDAASNLLKYLYRLESYGVLVRLVRRVPGSSRTSPGLVIWWLAIDLGWDAPVWRQVQRVLWNPNTGAPVALPAYTGEPS